MIRRLFTVASAISLLVMLSISSYKLLAADDDPRLHLWKCWIIMHRDNRIAIRFWNGSLWAFDYTLPYVLSIVCFIAAVLSNVSLLLGSRGDRTSDWKARSKWEWGVLLLLGLGLVVWFCFLVARLD